MLEQIKKASMGAFNASNPLDIEFGTVIDNVKLTIQINQKRILPKEFFIIPQRLTRYVKDLKHTHTCPDGTTSTALFKLVIREGLLKGDNVILLKIEGGARYIVLDKISETIEERTIES